MVVLHELHIHVQWKENTNFSEAAFSKKRQKVEVRESNDILVDDVWRLNRHAVPFCKRESLHIKHKQAKIGSICSENLEWFNNQRSNIQHSTDYNYPSIF